MSGDTVRIPEDIVESIKQYSEFLNVGLLVFFFSPPRMSVNYSFYFHSHGLGTYKYLTQ